MDTSARMQALRASLAEGDIQSVWQALERWTQTNPPEGDPWHLWGILLQQAGKFPEALAAYEAALARQPEEAALHNNLGVLQQQLGDMDQALHHYQQAYQLAPDKPEYISNLAQAALEQGDAIAALTWCRALLQTAPEAAESYYLLGCALISCGQQAPAEAALQQALLLESHHLQAHFHLGQLLQGQRRLQEASEHYRSLLQQLNRDLRPEVRPLYAQSCNQLAFCLREMGDAGQAADLYSQSLAILPRGTTAVAMNTLLAPIYPNHAAMERWRETFRAGLANLEAHPAELLSAPMQELPPLPFYLAYQGDDVRADLERFGRLFRPHLPAEILLARQPGERLRVAVVTQTLYTHSVMLFFARLLIALPQEAIELCLVTTAHPPQDPLTTALQARADQFICVPPRLEDLRRAVATLTADVIIYPDLGMDPLTYFLAQTRLAPMQVVWGGHPVTSGLSTLDAFFSWDHMEPEGAESHYSEPLIRCQSQPWQYAFPQLPEGYKDRRQLGLPDLGNLYVCPCMLFKIHPDMDAVFQAIIDQDRKAFIVLIGDPGSPDLQRQLQARFQRTITRKPQRIRFIPWLKGNDFYHVLAAADVILDPLHFGGGNVTYQAFAVGTPVVTWAGPFLRGRMTSALYHVLGMPEPMATDHTDYAHRAVRIATTPELRGMLKHNLLSHHETLFQRGDAGPEITDWLLRLSGR